ncbi:Signal transduction histidine kinase [Amycolatopsis xylanica]|uniref:Signal transduction histidine kinase n=1 Tax=Amycolatopsis xylanica TaxID=589385 RepID=A0A1H3SEE2_9PSEU|nr:Signal transduction histidine kinase [Amycolatopsis xylanica]
MLVIPCGLLGLLTVAHDVLVFTAVAVALLVAWCLSRLKWPYAHWVAAVQAATVVAIGLSQLKTGPQPVDSWVFVFTSVTSGTTQFEWNSKPLVAAGLSAVAIGAYWAGNKLAGPPGGWPPVAPVVRLVVEAALARGGYLLIRTWVRNADRGEVRAAALRRHASVEAARRAGEREYLAMLHDTASATLLMVATGTGRFDWLPERANRDLEALAEAPGLGAGHVDLAAMLSTLVEDSATRLDHLVEGPLPMPSTAAFGILHGVREAVANVEQHAGVDKASLTARVDESGIVVELADTGRGFDPGSVPPHRRGVSGSIVGRMATAGGYATVESRPGAGTTVRWRWPG